MFRAGTLVTEAETDPNWQTHPGQTGVVVRRADAEMGFSPGEGGFGRFWMVLIGDEEMVFQDIEMVVVQ